MVQSILGGGHSNYDAITPHSLIKFFDAVAPTYQVETEGVIAIVVHNTRLKEWLRLTVKNVFGIR